MLDKINNVWYKFCQERPKKPNESEIPEGMQRRFHYTSDDDVLDKIKDQGILVDKSTSWMYGDPRAVWSNPNMVNEYKPTVEFWEDPKKIIGDQYQYHDVPPIQIVAVHKSWHPYLHYLLDNYSLDEAIQMAEGVKDTPKYAPVYEALVNIKKKNAE